MLPFEIIVALDQDSGIGKEGALPWNLSGDMKYFKELTLRTDSPDKKNIVIMGRKTWESIPEQFRPLSGRMNIVLTRNSAYALPDGVMMATSLDEAFFRIKESLSESYEKIFVIGGAQIFKKAIELDNCCRLQLTQILSSFSCDTFFPSIPSDFHEIFHSDVFIENNIKYSFKEYSRE